MPKIFLSKLFVCLYLNLSCHVGLYVILYHLMSILYLIASVLVLSIMSITLVCIMLLYHVGFCHVNHVSVVSCQPYQSFLLVSCHQIMLVCVFSCSYFSSCWLVCHFRLKEVAHTQSVCLSIIL
jgi:hypothetical protein